MKAVLLKSAGNIKGITLTITKKDLLKDVDLYYQKFKKYLCNTKKKTTSIEQIDKWKINNEYTLVAYGNSSNQSLDINKHELFPTKNKKIYYGDILIIKINDANILDNITTTEYEMYYNTFYGYNENENDIHGDLDFSTILDDEQTDMSDNDDDDDEEEEDEMYESEISNNVYFSFYDPFSNIRKGKCAEYSY